MSHQGFFCFFYRIFVFSIRYYIQRGKRRSSVMRAAKFPAAGTDRKIPVKVRKKATAPVDGNRGSRCALRVAVCIAGRGMHCGSRHALRGTAHVAGRGVRCGARRALRSMACVAGHGVRCGSRRVLRGMALIQKSRGAGEAPRDKDIFFGFQSLSRTTGK